MISLSERTRTRMKNKGKLIVISGPSGVGKGTIVKRLLKECADTVLSVSATTRAPREEDTEGVTYFFKSPDEFRSMIDSEQFLEWAMYNENYYGTPAPAVDKLLSEGKNVILEIEVQGAMNVTGKRPEGKYIFVAPPSFEELKKRLVGRGSESIDEINKRVSLAKDEYDKRNEYDFIVVNDDLDTAVKDIKNIIEGN